MSDLTANNKKYFDDFAAKLSLRNQYRIAFTQKSAPLPLVTGTTGLTGTTGTTGLTGTTGTTLTTGANTKGSIWDSNPNGFRNNLPGVLLGGYRSGALNGDVQWDYVNTNSSTATNITVDANGKKVDANGKPVDANGKPVADIYVLYDKKGRDNEAEGTKTRSFEPLQVTRESKGAVPIANTFNSYLFNNNNGTTATINGTPEQLAENIMAGADNIKQVYAPGVTSDNGRTINAGVYSNEAATVPTKSTTIPNPDFGAIAHDDRLSAAEIAMQGDSTVKEAQYATGRQKLDPNAQFSPYEINKNQAVSSTVDNDGNEDYNRFYTSADENGDKYTDREELTRAITAISTQSGGNMIFDKTKLKEYLSRNRSNPVANQ